MKRVRKHGAVMVYSLFGLMTVTTIASLAVDWARVQLVRTQLHRAAVAASRAGAASLSGGTALARRAAKDQAALNRADGSSIVADDADVVIGKWNSATRQLDAAAANPDAVRVTLRRVASRGTGVQTLFASLFGRKTVDVGVSSASCYVTPIDLDVTVPATANPWLAGMPAGTVANPVNPHSNPDYAAGTPGKASGSPVLVGIPVVPGTELTFGNISGTSNNDVNFDPNVNYSPDGNFDWIVNNYYARGSNSGAGNGYENGLGDLRAPINAVIGVFIGAGQPDATPVPSAWLDYQFADQRDFSTLSPELKQPFFIGDGLRNDGTTVQRFIVPPGATRFYIAQMDQYEWNNNRGERKFKVSRPGKVVTVE